MTTLLFQCYRLPDPGLLLIWRLDQNRDDRGELRLARSPNFDAHSLLAVLPPRRRWALVADPGGEISAVHWRTDTGRTGRVIFSRRAPDEAIAEKWNRCGLIFRGEAGEALEELPEDTRQYDGLRASWRAVEGMGDGAVEWTNGTLLRPQTGVPRIEVTMAFRPELIVPVRKRTRESRLGDLTVHVKANACLRYPVRVWIDRLNAADRTPEAVTAYWWDGVSWSEHRTREWRLLPFAGEMCFKVPRLPEPETHIRPPRLAVDERDVFVVRTWPEIEVHHFVEWPSRACVESCEYRAGQMVAADPESHTVKLLTAHWQTRSGELSAGGEGPPGAWLDLPAERRVFLAEYRRWLEDLPPQMLRSFLCSEEVFPALVQLPVPFGSMVVKEALAASRLLADASDKENEAVRPLSFFKNPNFFHAVCDNPGLAPVLAALDPRSQALTNFTTAGFLFGRLAADERLNGELSRVSSEICWQYLVALERKARRDAIIELIRVQFKPTTPEEVLAAAQAIQELLAATELDRSLPTPDFATSLVSQLAALRHLLHHAVPGAPELRRLADSAKALRTRLDELLKEQRRQEKRSAVRAAITDFLGHLLPRAPLRIEEDEIDRLLSALPLALASGSSTPKDNPRLGNSVTGCHEELRGRIAEWKVQEEQSRASSIKPDRIAVLVAEMERALPSLALWEAIRRAKGDLDLELKEYERIRSRFGPVGQRQLDTLANQVRGLLSDSPPSAVGLLPVHDAFAETFAWNLAREREAQEVASLLAREAQAAFLEISLPDFENSEQYAEALQPLAADLLHSLMRREALLQTKLSTLRQISEVAKFPVELPISGGSEAPQLEGLAPLRPRSFADWIARLRSIEEALTHAERALDAELSRRSGGGAEEALDWLRRGDLVSAAQILERFPQLERYQEARKRLCGLVSKSKKVMELLACEPPLLAGPDASSEDGTLFARCRRVLLESADAASIHSAAPEQISLAADVFQALWKAIYERDRVSRDLGGTTFRGCIASAFQRRCDLAWEALTAGPRSAASALLEIPPEDWSCDQLIQAERLTGYVKP